MKKVLIISLAALVFGCNLKKQPEKSTGTIESQDVSIISSDEGFTDYAEDPVVFAPGDPGEWDDGAIGSAAIIKVTDTYHMYYEAWSTKVAESGKIDLDYTTLQVGHATSKDGISWVRDPANPVIELGKEGDFDMHGTWDPYVVYKDGIFKMWYGGRVETGGTPRVVCDWGYAESSDGSTFKKMGRISHVGGMEDLSVLHNPDDGKYYMFYWNRMIAPWSEVMDGLPSPSGLSVAVSDDGMSFDFENARVINIEGQDWPVKFPQVIPEKDKWIMVYGEAKVRGEPASTGIAVSDDLYNWEKAVFPVIKGHDVEILKMGEDLWYMYYAPDAYFDMLNADIRLATYKGKLSDLFE
jgi:predicted GH43/DUF377 family glycosyl hydrolase